MLLYGIQIASPFFPPFNSSNLKRLINLCVCYNLFYLFNGYENALHYLNILVL